MTCIDDGLDPTINSATPLSRADLELIFRKATSGFVHHYKAQFSKGMSDGELWKALQESLGIFGGSGGPGSPSITYRGAGLKIWGAWEVVNHVTTAPYFLVMLQLRWLGRSMGLLTQTWISWTYSSSTGLSKPFICQSNCR